ncbi:MAG: hypothetical protein IKD10_12110 [Lentisphaeria bacterium]|nr:hypothetical protein [Lentisphaeria bacterium]
MDVLEFLKRCGDFFVAEVLPATYPNMDQTLIRFIGKGVNGVIVYKGSRLAASLREPLTACGILNEAGEIDLDLVQAFLESGFADNDCVKIKTLPLVPEVMRNVMPRFSKKYCNHTWTFRKSDADKFLALLRQ